MLEGKEVYRSQLFPALARHIIENGAASKGRIFQRDMPSFYPRNIPGIVKTDSNYLG